MWTGDVAIRRILRYSDTFGPTRMDTHRHTHLSTYIHMYIFLESLGLFVQFLLDVGIFFSMRVLCEFYFIFGPK